MKLRKLRVLVYAVCCFCLLTGCSSGTAAAVSESTKNGAEEISDDSALQTEDPLSEESLTGDIENSSSVNSDGNVGETDEFTIALVRAGDRMPWNVQDEWTAQCLMLVCDPLFEHSSKDELIPALADSYSFGTDEQGNVYADLVIRENICFHDGSALDASDVVYTINQLKSKNNYYSSQVSGILSVQTVNARTVRLFLSENGIAVLMGMNFPIVPSGSQQLQMPLGTGPYCLTEVIGKRELTLTANQNYYKGVPCVESVRVFLVQSEEDIRTCFDSGRINLYTADQLEWGRYSNQKQTSVYSYLSHDLVYMEFSSSGVLSDREDRVTLLSLIDMENVLQESFYGRGSLSVNMLYPDAWYSETEDTGYEADEEKQKSLASKISSLVIGYDGSDSVLEQAAASVEKQLETAGFRIVLNSSGEAGDIVLKRESVSLLRYLQLSGVSEKALTYRSEEQLKQAAAEGAGILMQSMDKVGMFYLQGGTVTGWGISGTLTPWEGHVFMGIESLSGGETE